MSNPVIRVENLGKKYAIAHQKRERYTALRDVLVEGVKSLLKPDKKRSAVEEFWALKDISFEIKEGDRIGIIGRNGAGKSTLLKILSRITEPTTGRISLRGRVASLLEVGTGFHPELTGRENIYLNGAILGMGKVEIRRKFDEIVAFAEVEKFLDTPVKRYSSGMYVRLAFAVAAHLEPEILIVDEVLAVGDAQFQKKCLGKMEDVANNEGRTVLFVSHNMAAVEALCSEGILIENGCIRAKGSAQSVVAQYQQSTLLAINQVKGTDILAFSNKHEIGINSLQVNISKSEEQNKHLDLVVKFNVFSDKKKYNIGVGVELYTLSGIRLSTMAPSLTNYVISSLEGSVGCLFKCSNITKYLASGDYIINIWLSKPRIEYLLKVENATIISLSPIDIYGTGVYFESSVHGWIPLELQFEYHQETFSSTLYN